MTTTYTLWDIPSSTLLLETTSVVEVEESATLFLQDNGTDSLDELLLGVSTTAPASTREFSGSSILQALQRERIAQSSA